MRIVAPIFGWARLSRIHGQSQSPFTAHLRAGQGRTRCRDRGQNIKARPVGCPRTEASSTTNSPIQWDRRD